VWLGSVGERASVLEIPVGSGTAEGVGEHDPVGAVGLSRTGGA
jgi:hypothetical protein